MVLSSSSSTPPPAPAPIPLPTADSFSPKPRRKSKDYTSPNENSVPSLEMDPSIASPQQLSTRTREESTETTQEFNSQRTSIDSRPSTSTSTLPSSVPASQFANSPSNSPFPSQKASSYTALAPPIASSRTVPKPSISTSSTRHQNFDSTLSAGNRQPRSSHSSKSPFKKALAALGLSEKDKVRREERASYGSREEKPKMGPVDSAREQGRRVLRYVKRKLNSKTPKEELPRTWEEYGKAYAAVSFLELPLPASFILNDHLLFTLPLSSHSATNRCRRSSSSSDST